MKSAVYSKSTEVKRPILKVLKSKVYPKSTEV